MHGVARLVRDVASAPVVAEDATRGSAEREEERDERAEREPVRISVLREVACIVVALATDTEEDHVDDPRDEGGEQREACEERHHNSPHAMITCTNDPAEKCNAREARGC